MLKSPQRFNLSWWQGGRAVYLAGMERMVRIMERESTVPDKVFWRSRTPQQRLAALEFLRAQYMAHIHAEQRLQRICRVVAGPQR